MGRMIYEWQGRRYSADILAYYKPPPPIVPGPDGWAERIELRDGTVLWGDGDRSWWAEPFVRERARAIIYFEPIEVQK